MAALSSITDAGLVARCRSGDDDAWEELVRRFSRYVLAIAQQAYRLSPSDAEDVFQDVFAKTYERLGDLRSDDAVRPWIAQLTRRLCIDRIRAGARETVDPEAAEAGVDDTLDQLDEALSVQEALAAMSEPCRDILDRFFRRDESYAVIGAALGLPSGTIASRISRCLGKLRDLLMEENAPLTRHEE
ncbi:MAG TPA: sigma-70 family RNA polymerase sigma factor [Gaiellales bacterium]|jgi:RNA polymerase sigma-70 factor (ECF subfamily)|nr:sigma-70 family RNA polymerase sigma factor [Gaiellales bacterium]